MKKLLLLVSLGLFCSGVTVAQEEGTEKKKEIVKTKDFKMFGSEWHYEKYSDKTFTLESEDGDMQFDGKEKRAFERSLNLDLGINTWINDDSAPVVKPWGSWNVGINFQRQYKMGNNFSLNPALGVSWYNFKFEERNLIALKTAQEIEFQDFTDGTGTKSKISASYVNLSLIPTFHSSDGKFRFGIGPYAGLRIGGRGKFVYDDQDGRSRKIFERSNMYANNFRYGGRVTLGISNVDLYVNYDLNEFFETDKGPRVNALSFGLIL